jgi:hypothetical protein
LLLDLFLEAGFDGLFISSSESCAFSFDASFFFLGVRVLLIPFFPGRLSSGSFEEIQSVGE